MGESLDSLKGKNKMKRVLNKSARMITIPIVETLENGKRMVKGRVSFPPLKLVRLENDDWKLIKKVSLVKKMIEEGELLEGSAASKEAVSDKSVMDELEKDLDGNDEGDGEQTE